MKAWQRPVRRWRRADTPYSYLSLKITDCDLEFCFDCFFTVTKALFSELDKEDLIMATGKHEHLIKPLSLGAINWEEKEGQPGASVIGPGNAKKEIWLNGRDHLEGLNLNFSWGVHNTLGEWHAGSKPHVHPYPECLLFVGLDTANVNYLGAEIDCCLGEEQETYTFNEPTVIVIPAGLPHGPITTKRMFSPRGFGFWAVELNAASGSHGWKGRVRKRTRQPAGKYAHLVKPLKSGLITERGKFNPLQVHAGAIRPTRRDAEEDRGKPGPGNADHLTWMCGKDLEGLNVNIFWGFCSQPGIWRRGVGAHCHPADEVLIFLGTDPDNMDYLGAEIEIDMGEEHERHLINKPTVVICPAGVPHCRKSPDGSTSPLRSFD